MEKILQAFLWDTFVGAAPENETKTFFLPVTGSKQIRVVAFMCTIFVTSFTFMKKKSIVAECFLISVHCKCLQRITGTLPGNRSAGISNLWGLHV